MTMTHDHSFLRQAAAAAAKQSISSITIDVFSPLTKQHPPQSTYPQSLG